MMLTLAPTAPVEDLFSLDRPNAAELSSISTSHHRSHHTSHHTSHHRSHKLLTRFPLLQAVIEGFMDGLMIVTEQGQVIEANSQVRQIAYRLRTTHQAHLQPLRDEIWRVCEALIDSRELFPDQSIVPESEITLAGLKLRIRARWLEFDHRLNDALPEQMVCILVTLEDRVQTLQNVAIADIRRYRLTASEAQVWQLRVQGLSYDEIAEKLFVTKNTVKKHIKNTLAKRRALGGNDRME